MITSEILKKRLDQLKESFDRSVVESIETKAGVYSKYISFNLNNEFFAWPVSNLKEILVNQKILPIPGKLETLYGMLNYKNMVLSVTNLHHLLELTSVEVGEENTLLVSRGLPVETALWVDGLGPVLSIAKGDIKHKPLRLEHVVAEMITGEYYHRGQLIAILNPVSIPGSQIL